MSTLVVILRALAPLFALIAAGYLLKRNARILHPAHVPILNGIVLNVTLPALIFLAIMQAPAVPLSTFRLPLFLLLAELATMAVGLGIGRLLKLPRTSQGMLMMVGVFGNTAFLGYPITMSLLPHQFPAAVLLDEFGMMIVMYVCSALICAAFGMAQGENAGPSAALLRFARGPIFLSVAAAMAVRILPWPHALLSLAPLRFTGEMAVRSLNYLAQGTTPMILLAVGAALKPSSVTGSPHGVLLPSAFKLVVCPIAMWGVCHAAGLHGDQLRVGVLQASMPTGVLASVLCAQNEMEGPVAGGVVFATTLLSAITIPLALSFLR